MRWLSLGSAHYHPPYVIYLIYTTACNFCLYMVARLQFSALCITHGGVPPRCAQTHTHTDTCAHTQVSTPVLILAAIFDLVLVLVFRRKCILVLVIFILLSFSLVFVDENSEHFSLVLVDEVSLHFSLVLVTLN